VQGVSGRTDIGWFIAVQADPKTICFESIGCGFVATASVAPLGQQHSIATRNARLYRGPIRSSPW